MTMDYFNQTRKGQSAIEYLTTYGWMLLVVAIVGGAIFTTVQGQTNISNSSGFSNADVRISQFGMTSDGLSVEFRAAASQAVTINQVNITEEGTPTNGMNRTGLSITIPVGETKTVQFDNFTEGNTQRTYNVDVVYDSGGIPDLIVSGTITGTMTTN
ncbi:hypothetical protein GKQ38_03865 [Candidatus Nanohaloarchaea archaeon]|nr:hypothetical protein GKQ38_03865 [Candidatus Nanohaloarchaea archaeon]